jgi:beta-RFAP synthase
MIRVRTASRLHFGLLSLAADDSAGPVPPRRYGGAGLMVESPGLELTAAPAPAWTAEGPLAARALDFARRFADSLDQDRIDGDRPPQRLTVVRAAAEHAGLGTGTQLGLAAARALSRAWGLDLDAPELARRAGRGLRSGVGVHGFAHGGFLIDAGRRSAGGLAPLAARVAFPDDWRVVLLRPPAALGLHGPGEREAFARLPGDDARTEALCRLALLGLLPALAEQDLRAFGEALYEYNRRAGEGFAAVQGGPYAGPFAPEAVAWARRRGVRGAGQSSWGPTVFAVVADQEGAERLVEAARAEFGPAIEALATQGRNGGAAVEAARRDG